MLLRRAGRLPAAALGRACKPPGPFLVQVLANRPRDWTLSLRNDHTLRPHRCLSVSAAGAKSAAMRLCKQPLDPHPLRSWDSSCGFVATQWEDWNKANSVAENIRRSSHVEGGRHLRITRQPLVGVKRRHISGGPSVGEVLFTPNWGVCSCATRTMEIRASSTVAAAKKSEGRTTDGSTGDEQNLKEPSAAEKAPVEPEPEGGKPNKTQQLKKVFKEYGAVGVSFHIGISLMSLGMFYLLLSSGMDMAAVLCRLGFSEGVVQSKMAAGTSTFVLAYAIHKLFAPVRISITLVSVPLIVRYCRKTGLFKPPTPAP